MVSEVELLTLRGCQRAQKLKIGCCRLSGSSLAPGSLRGELFSPAETRNGLLTHRASESPESCGLGCSAAEPPCSLSAHLFQLEFTSAANCSPFPPGQRRLRWHQADASSLPAPLIPAGRRGPVRCAGQVPPAPSRCVGAGEQMPCGGCSVEAPLSTVGSGGGGAGTPRCCKEGGRAVGMAGGPCTPGLCGRARGDGRAQGLGAHGGGSAAAGERWGAAAGDRSRAPSPARSGEEISTAGKR